MDGLSNNPYGPFYRTPALPLQIVCHLLGSGNQLHPTGLYQPALTLSHHTPTALYTVLVPYTLPYLRHVHQTSHVAALLLKHAHRGGPVGDVQDGGQPQRTCTGSASVGLYATEGRCGGWGQGVHVRAYGSACQVSELNGANIGARFRK